MSLPDRLHTALFENILLEMSSFSLPIPITLPDGYGGTVSVKYLDMRWEDYKNPYISKWGQWTPFSAQLPDGRYLIWNGVTAWISQHPSHEFYTAPRDWWTMAQGMDEKGREVLRPKVLRNTEKVYPTRHAAKQASLR